MRPGELRVIVIDDEPHALKRLGSMLTEHRDVDVVARCRGGEEAIDAISAKRPDAIFVDIFMPEIDGFGVVGQFLDDDCPEVVFVTAFDEYALRAFDARAIDYLLKPVRRERLAETLDRIRERIGDKRSGDRASALENTIDELRSARGGASVDARRQDLWIRHQGRAVRVAQRDIEWVEAEREYVRFHTRDTSLMRRESMKSIEKKLDPDMFVRAHRSAIVNLSHVVRSHTVRAGYRVLHMTSGTKIRVGRSYAMEITRLLKLDACG